MTAEATTLPEDASFVSRSAEETREIAARLVRGLKPGAVVALHGDLGSGKTCFVQGMARALGVRQPVASPTFTLINEYAGVLPLYHVDLYRVDRPDDLFGIGFEVYMESRGITAVEWAERAGDLIPPGAVHVHLLARPDPDEREIRITTPARTRTPRSGSGRAPAQTPGES
jgi:tRNA threonylcarbamoyladenosine biosynthesis protein TsaE